MDRAFCRLPFFLQLASCSEIVQALDFPADLPDDVFNPLSRYLGGDLVLFIPVRFPRIFPVIGLVRGYLRPLLTPPSKFLFSLDVFLSFLQFSVAYQK